MKDAISHAVAFWLGCGFAALGLVACGGDDPVQEQSPATTTLDLEEVFGPRPTRGPATSVVCQAIEPPPGQDAPSYICRDTP